jgi:hypothetical protein
MMAQLTGLVGMLPDIGWINAVMALLCASNFVVSSIRTVLIVTGQ